MKIVETDNIKEVQNHGLRVMMTEVDIKNNWYYFRSLAKQLQDTEQYVDHSIGTAGMMLNAGTFSNEFAKILLLVSSEFEVIAKTLCVEAGLKIPWNANIVRITKEIKSNYPHIGDTLIRTPYQSFQPLQNWTVVQVTNKNGKTEDQLRGISWWEDHNKIKHNRRNYFQTAHLKNCVDAMACLMILELYLSQTALGNVDIITTLGCCYFDCDYGLSHLSVHSRNKLPDFA